jgi:abequosyltransferase
VINPILSIVIPTYNRARFLALALEGLREEISNVAPDSVEVIVSDNASEDDTAAVVEAAIAHGLSLRAIRNPNNLGSDANIAQVFNMASAPYVLILGDDDLLVAGTLRWLVATLHRETYGVICMKPYGYDRDPVREYPGGAGAVLTFDDSGNFIATLGAHVTLISACVINKSLLGNVDARAFCGGNLVQVHLVLAAALAARKNLLRTTYSVACKRNNSGGYDFTEVFVSELGRILDSFVGKGLSQASLDKFGRRMMLSYYPTYLLRGRRNGSPAQQQATYRIFSERFGKDPFFWIWIAPILRLPRRLALVWGYCVVAIGRSLGGDFRRGLAFLRK